MPEKIRVKPLLILASLFNLLIFSYFIFAADRSLGLADEGSLLLGYRFYQETLNSLTFFWLLIGKSFNWLDPGIAFYRLIRLALLAISTLVFSHGLFSYLKNKTTIINNSSLNLLTTYAVILNFALLSLAGVVPTISYNTLNGDFCLIISGLFLSYLADQKKEKALLFILIGFFSFLQLLIKFPSSLMLLLIILLILLADKETRKIKRIFSLSLYLLAGVVLAIISFFIIFYPAGDFFINLHSALASWTSGGHHPSKAIWRYLRDVVFSAKVLAKPFFFFWLAIFCWFYNLSLLEVKRKSLAKTAIVLGLIILLLWGYQLLSFEVWNPGRYTLNLLICGFLAVIAVARRYPLNRLTIFLFLLPISVAFGTDTAITNNISHCLAPWGALLLVSLFFTARDKLQLQRVVIYFIAGLVIINSLHTLNRAINHSYSIPTSIFKQNQQIKHLTALGSLKVDIKTAEFLEKLNNLLTSKTYYKKGGPLISAYELPGLVYLLAGVQPGAAWYHAPQGEQARNCSAILSSKRKDLAKTIIIQNQKELEPQFVQCLQQAGIDYPNNYRQVAKVEQPHQIWGPREITIYAPLAMIRY